MLRLNLAPFTFRLPAGIRRHKARQAKAASVLNLVRLDRHLEQYPHQLSRGEQQRVALARALAGDPAVLLLDEPFSSLDLEMKREMVGLVAEIRRSRDITIIYVTHTVDELPMLADRVATLNYGHKTPLDCRSGGFLKDTADDFRECRCREGDELANFRRDFLHGNLSRLQFLAHGFNVNLGKSFFERGLTLEQDF